MESSQIECIYTEKDEQLARHWMESVVKRLIDPNVPGDEPFGPDRLQKALKDGVFLCLLVEAVTGTKINVNHGKFPFSHHENIAAFLGAVDKFGVQTSQLFESKDLYENKDMGKVLGCIHALGCLADGKGPRDLPRFRQKSAPQDWDPPQ